MRHFTHAAFAALTLFSSFALAAGNGYVRNELNNNTFDNRGEIRAESFAAGGAALNVVGAGQQLIQPVLAVWSNTTAEGNTFDNSGEITATGRFFGAAHGNVVGAGQQVVQ